MWFDLGPIWILRSGSRYSWLWFLAFYSLVANLPYWFASREFAFIPLGWFCIQYVTVGLLALFLPRLVSALLLFAVILGDLLCGVCRSYSLPLGESFENLRVAHDLPGVRISFAIAVILLGVFVAAASMLLPAAALTRKQRWRAAGGLLAFGAFIAGADILFVGLATGGLPPTLRRSNAIDGVDLRISRIPRLARFPVVQLTKIELADAALQKKENSSTGPALDVPSAMAVAVRRSGILSDQSGAEAPNLVLIVVESWGEASDPQLKNALTQPYLQAGILAKYDVVQGSVPFAGATVPGESRELCGKSYGFHLLNASRSTLQGCLPDRLAAIGYHSVAVHGMNGNLFNRANWYKTIGFQEIWFHDQFKDLGLPDCPGVFIGTCDANIADWIGRRLDEDSPRPYFIHWMTLNSHLPVLVPAPLTNGAPCTSSLSLAPDTPLCSWYQLVANVHRSVAELAAGNLARPTVFAIVGDHAPPFADPAMRDTFSQLQVPYVILLPRAGRSPARATVAHNAAEPVRGSSRQLIQIP